MRLTELATPYRVSRAHHVCRDDQVLVEPRSDDARAGMAAIATLGSVLTVFKTAYAADAVVPFAARLPTAEVAAGNAAACHPRDMAFQHRHAVVLTTAFPEVSVPTEREEKAASGITYVIPHVPPQRHVHSEHERRGSRNRKCGGICGGRYSFPKVSRLFYRMRAVYRAGSGFVSRGSVNPTEGGRK